MLTRIDMSEYQERHTVSRLVGAPPGYVGYEEGGQLTEAVRRKPYSVVLLDEIEKAHPDVFNVLLQVLDDGRLTDNKGRTVDFKNTILIMTSNVGSDVIQDSIAQGVDFDDCRDKVLELLKHSVRPEFLNRIDEIIMFHPLSRENVREILGIQIADLQRKLEAMDVHLKFTDNFIDYLSDKGYNPVYGARPIKRVLQRDLIDELAKELLEGRLSKDQTITADMKDGVIVLK